MADLEGIKLAQSLPKRCDSNMSAYQIGCAMVFLVLGRKKEPNVKSVLDSHESQYKPIKFRLPRKQSRPLQPKILQDL